MSEIEKLMQNAVVKKKYYSIYRTNKQCEGIVDCIECASANYPEFTAEKQLELIKWLTKREDFALGYYPSYNTWVAKTDFCWEYYEKTYEHKEPEQALAGLINNLWIDLTDTEKAEIKRILE